MNKLNQFFTAKYITRIALIILVSSALFIFFNLFNLYQANKFNNEILNGETPSFFEQSFEARYATAYWLAKKEIFKEHGKSESDTGSAEGQIALFTKRINHLTEHLKKNRKDFNTERSLVMMVGKRKSLLIR